VTSDGYLFEIKMPITEDFFNESTRKIRFNILVLDVDKYSLNKSFIEGAQTQLFWNCYELPFRFYHAMDFGDLVIR
jgi:hypothetical protein